jgi:hypothetical protein
MLKSLKAEWKTYPFDDLESYRQFSVCFVAKQNEGPVGPVVFRFRSEFARFEPEDPDRPLFSNRPEERQEKPLEKGVDPDWTPPGEGNGEPDEDEIKRLLRLAEKEFPGAKEI